MRRCLNCMEEYPDGSGDRCPYCGYQEGATQNGGSCLPAGTILQARYIVGTPISVRDIDLVYRAWDALFDRKVCIQEYFPSRLASRSGQTGVAIREADLERYQEGLKVFCRDSRELIRLYKESDVVTYHACFQENGTAYAVMDYRDDPTLEAWLEQQPIDRKTAKLLSDRAWNALDKCHKIGVSHGRLTAQSFYITSAGLILKDFGSWKYPCADEQEQIRMGSPAEADSRALSALYYQMITGKGSADQEEEPSSELVQAQPPSPPAAEYDSGDSITLEIPYTAVSSKKADKKADHGRQDAKKPLFSGFSLGGVLACVAGIAIIILAGFLLHQFFYKGETESPVELAVSEYGPEKLEAMITEEETEPEVSSGSGLSETETPVKESERQKSDAVVTTKDPQTEGAQESQAVEVTAEQETKTEISRAESMWKTETEESAATKSQKMETEEPLATESRKTETEESTAAELQKTATVESTVAESQKTATEVSTATESRETEMEDSVTVELSEAEEDSATIEPWEPKEVVTVQIGESPGSAAASSEEANASAPGTD